MIDVIRFSAVFILVVYIVALVYYLPAYILASFDSNTGRLFTLILVVYLSMTMPDVALLVVIAYLTTVQVYRNRLELLVQ